MLAVQVYRPQAAASPALATPLAVPIRTLAASAAINADAPTSISPLAGLALEAAVVRPSPLRIPELLALILTALPPGSLTPALLTVHSSFHAALLPALWRTVKLGEVPRWRKFVRAVREGSDGAAWIHSLDLRVTTDVLDRGLVDGLGRELERGRFTRLRSLAVLGSVKSTAALVNGPFLGNLDAVVPQLTSLSLDGHLPPAALLALLARSIALDSLALQAQTLSSLPPTALFDGPPTLVVLPSTPYPCPSSMIYPRWVEELVDADVAHLGRWLDMLLGAAPARPNRRLQTDLSAFLMLDVNGGRIRTIVRERAKALREIGVDLVGAPVRGAPAPSYA
jgi:hypothetical protein